MTIEANKMAIRRAVANLSPDTLETYLQLYHPDAKLHFLPPGLPQGVEGARIFYQRLLSAFPDLRLSIEDFVADGDSVAVRFTLEGTHRGAFMGVPATEKRITTGGISILLFSESKCVERWNETNLVWLLQQIGGLPIP